MSTALTSGFNITFSMIGLSAILCSITGLIYLRIGHSALLIALIGLTHGVIDILRCIYLGAMYNSEIRNSENFPGWMAVLVCISQFWNTAFNMASLFAMMHMFLMLSSAAYQLDVRRSITIMTWIGFAISALNLIITYAMINPNNYFIVPFQYINFIALCSLLVVGLPCCCTKLSYKITAYFLVGVCVMLYRSHAESERILARASISLSLCYRLLFNSIGLAIVTSITLQSNIARLGQATPFTPPYELANQTRFLSNSYIGINLFVVLITSDESMRLIRERVKSYLGIEIPKFTFGSQMTESSMMSANDMKNVPRVGPATKAVRRMSDDV